MNRRRLWIVLALAATSGIAAAFASVDYLRSQARPVLGPTTRDLKVAVAARDLPLGTLVRAEDVRLADWPGELVPVGYAATVEEVVGRGVMSKISMNEPFLAGKLADRGAGGGLPIVIPEGMRALSVRVDEVISVAGFVVPGTRVDVIVTIEPPQGSGERLSRTILQNVQALTAGQAVERNAEGKPMTVTVITLLVTPEQAEALTLASNEGRIQLALRNTLDGEQVTTSGMRVANLMGAAPSRPSRPGATTQVRRVPTTTEPERSPVVEMFKGGERTLLRF